MTTTSNASVTTDVVPSYLDVTRLALTSFLASCREPTLSAYQQDFAAFLGWCDRYDLRPHGGYPRAVGDVRDPADF